MARRLENFNKRDCQIINMEEIELACGGCNRSYNINVDPEVLNPKKLKIKSCKHCPNELREKAFKELFKHGMKPKKIRVKEIPGMEVIAEIKPIQLKRYK